MSFNNLHRDESAGVKILTFPYFNTIFFLNLYLFSFQVDLNDDHWHDTVDHLIFTASIGSCIKMCNMMS